MVETRGRGGGSRAAECHVPAGRRRRFHATVVVACAGRPGARPSMLRRRGYCNTRRTVIILRVLYLNLG